MAAAAAGLVGARPGTSTGGSPVPPAEVPLPTSSSMDVAAAAGPGSSSSTSSSSGSSGSSQEGEEPELALVLIACGIGLATGAAIVGFNVGVHLLRDAIWLDQPLLSANRELLRSIAESELWPKVVFPPFLGGLAVGALGLAIGGYDDVPPPRLGDGSSASNNGSAGGAKQQGTSGGSSSGGGSGGGGAVAVAGAGAGAAAAAPSSSLAIEQWKLQAVLRPVSRALAAILTLGSGETSMGWGPALWRSGAHASGGRQWYTVVLPPGLLPLTPRPSLPLYQPQAHP